MFSAELHWCIIFVKKSKFLEKSGKIPEIIFLQKTHGARRGAAGASHSPQMPPGRGPGLAAPGSHLAKWWLGWRRPFHLFTPFDLKTPEPPIIFPEKIQSAAATSKPNSGTRSSCSGTLPGRGLKGRSSPSPSSPPLHQPSMFPPSMCE